MKVSTWCKYLCQDTPGMEHEKPGLSFSPGLNPREGLTD